MTGTLLTGWATGTTSSGRRALAAGREYGVLLVLGALVVVFSLATPAFFTTANLRNLLDQAGLPLLIACGMSVVIVAGEFDLSVGAIYGFAAVVTAKTANTAGVPLAVAVGMVFGAALGLINGLIVAAGRIQSFLVTLATQFIYVGVALALTHAKDTVVVNAPTGFARLAQSAIGGIELKAWIAGTVLVLTWLVLRNTAPGKQVYAVGGDATAARVAGVRTRVVLTAAFVVSGLAAAAAGILATSDNGLAQADGGIGMEFTAITAVVIGGTSIAGGRGSVVRTVIGVLLLAVISNGFTLLYVNPNYSLLVQGAIILVAVLIDARLKARSAP